MIKRNSLIAVLIALCVIAPRAFASTGCTYPTTLDSWTDKIAGDFLTIADVNQFRCAIEKLETGPLRPNDGSAAAPSYAFRGSVNTGMFLIGGPGIGWATAGAERMRLSNAGALLIANSASTGVNAGDVVLSNNRNVLWVNNAGTTAGNFWIKTATTDAMSFGTSGVEALNIASNGAMRVGNQAATGVAANSIVLKNTASIQWVTASGATAADLVIQATAGNHMWFNVPASDGQLYQFNWGGQTLFQITRELAGAGLIFALESTTDQSPPAANQAVVYTKDNGSGKTQLCARFNTGAAQCFATQP